METGDQVRPARKSASLLSVNCFFDVVVDWVDKGDPPTIFKSLAEGTSEISWFGVAVGGGRTGAKIRLLAAGGAPPNHNVQKPRFLRPALLEHKSCRPQHSSGQKPPVLLLLFLVEGGKTVAPVRATRHDVHSTRMMRKHNMRHSNDWSDLQDQAFSGNNKSTFWFHTEIRGISMGIF